MCDVEVAVPGTCAAWVNGDSGRLLEVLSTWLLVNVLIEYFFLMCDRMYEVPLIVYLASDFVRAW